MLQNPDIVLVHYLNVPLGDEQKLCPAASIPSVSLLAAADTKEWTKEELTAELRPMCKHQVVCENIQVWDGYWLVKWVEDTLYYQYLFYVSVASQSQQQRPGQAHTITEQLVGNSLFCSTSLCTNTNLFWETPKCIPLLHTLVYWRWKNAVIV